MQFKQRRCELDMATPKRPEKEVNGQSFGNGSARAVYDKKPTIKIPLFRTLCKFANKDKRIGSVQVDIQILK